MHFNIVTGRPGRPKQLELSGSRLVLMASVLIAAIFITGLGLGRFVIGASAEQRALARTLVQQRQAIQAARGQLDGQVDALAARVGSLNAQLIRLDALGKRLTEVAGLDRGEFDFGKAPPAGGPDASDQANSAGGSSEVPELAKVLDSLESEVSDREQQLIALETVLASRQLGKRIRPGGLPLIGGWISSHFGYRADPFTGYGAFHAGVDFAGAPGSRVVAVGPGVVSFAGYKQGYGNVVEITHSTGFMTRYGHNSRNLVRTGQSVQKGDPIAVIGSTGRATGTHVHFEVLRNGRAVDPSRYLASG
jgi:murein DD-endopeptidase MepM/ murein hydrolase activator NlpD